MTKDRIMSNLNTKVWSRSIVFAIVLALLLFVPAGTIEYWQAWVYLVVFFASSVAVTIYLMNKDPALLMRRMKAGPTAEREKTQKIIMFFAMVSFVTIFLVSALDYRFMWSPVPLAVVIGGDIVVALGFFITFLVVKENTFASATIEITKDQSVISTGPYAIVRHPMYSGGLLIVLGTPLALGSLWGFLTFIPTSIWIVWRLLDEEKFLAKNLAGYDEYRAKIRYRLVPHVW